MKFECARIHRLASPVAVVVACGGLFTDALSSPVNGTGFLTSEVIFGSGNADGAFSGTTDSALDIELAMRGKLRYDTNGQPQNTFNYDGVDTYSFSPTEGNAPANRSVWNVDWSVNTNVSGSSGNTLDDYIFALFFDVDPTAMASFQLVDGVVAGNFRDHSIGTNTTANGAGIEAADVAEYNTLLGQNNVAQNSWNLGFGALLGLDPQLQGQFSVVLNAYHASDFGLTNALATTRIEIIYGNVPVPAPTTLPLLGLGAFLGFTMSRRRPPSSAPRA